MSDKAKEMKAKEETAFHAIMKLIAPNNQDEAIRLWVEGTHSSWSLGWSQGFDAGYDK